MEENKPKPIPNVETYTDDMVKAIEGGEGGLIKRMIHEQEEHEKEKRNLSPESRKNKLFMLLGSVLLLVGVGILFYLFMQRNDPIPIEAPVGLPQSPIFLDQVSFWEVGGLKPEQIPIDFSYEISKGELAAGKVKGLYFTENKKLISFERLLGLIQSSFFENKISPLEEQFLAGVVNGESFFLVQVQSFADVFPVLLAWEKKMFFELHEFFGMSISPETTYLLTKEFEDAVVWNKNARVLLDDVGTPVLMYIVASDHWIIITESKFAAREVIRRLSSSELQK